MRHYRWEINVILGRALEQSDAKAVKVIIAILEYSSNIVSENLSSGWLHI